MLDLVMILIFAISIAIVCICFFGLLLNICDRWSTFENFIISFIGLIIGFSLLFVSYTYIDQKELIVYEISEHLEETTCVEIREFEFTDKNGQTYILQVEEVD